MSVSISGNIPINIVDQKTSFTMNELSNFVDLGERISKKHIEECDKRVGLLEKGKKELIDEKDLRIRDKDLAIKEYTEKETKAQSKLDKEKRFNKIAIEILTLLTLFCALALFVFRQSPDTCFVMSILFFFIVFLLIGFILWIIKKEFVIVVVLVGEVGLYLFATGSIKSEEIHREFLRYYYKITDQKDPVLNGTDSTNSSVKKDSVID